MQRTPAPLILLALIPFSSLFAYADGKIVLTTRLKPAGQMRAVSESLKGDIERTTDGIAAGRLTVKLDSFDTGIGYRTDNFRKFLKADQHPIAMVTGLKGAKGKATAELEINGIKKSIQIDYEQKAKQLIGTFMVRLKDFNLEPASYALISTGDEVKVEITMPEPTADPTLESGEDSVDAENK